MNAHSQTVELGWLSFSGQFLADIWRKNLSCRAVKFSLTCYVEIGSMRGGESFDVDFSSMAGTHYCESLGKYFMCSLKEQAIFPVHLKFSYL